MEGKRQLPRRFLRKRGAAGGRLLALGELSRRVHQRGFKSAEPEEKRLKDLHAEQACTVSFFRCSPLLQDRQGRASP